MFVSAKKLVNNSMDRLEIFTRRCVSIRFHTIFIPEYDIDRDSDVTTTKNGCWFIRD